MEWAADLQYSPSLHFEMDKATAVWTFEENKMFENALAEIDPSSPAFFENVGSRVPWKTIEEIKIHYQALVEDVGQIESGNFPVPDYGAPEQNVCDRQGDEILEANKLDEGSSSAKNGQQRRRGVPWTEEEHQLFLMGLNKYGKGDWRSISRYYVITKTPTQVASHAQKYFRRQTSSTPVDRRRPSIHDIQNVNYPTTFTPLPHDISNNKDIEPIPNFSSCGCGIIPVLHHHFNGGITYEQHPMFLPMNSASPSGHDIFFQGSRAHHAPYFLSSMMRNQE